MPFQKAREREISPFFIVEVWGHEKAGKTRFCLTAPPPIYVYNFDKGYDRVERNMVATSATIPIEPPFAERYEKGLIVVTDYSAIIKTRGKSKKGGLQADDVENGKEVLDQFESDWFAMVDGEVAKNEKLPPGGTAVIDTGTLIWNIAGHVLKKKAPPNQPWIQYTMRNDFFRRLLGSARDSGRHVMFVHHDTEIMGEEGKTVGHRAQGDKLVSRAADVIVRMRTEKQRGKGLPVYLTSIEDCGLNAELTGMELPNATFDDLIESVLV